MLEKKYAGNAEFQAYARRTSAFVPWVPKNS
jgi:steroid 5-alpha reductase family enzyme